MASKLVEAGGRASVIKSEKWTKSLDFYIITHVLKSEAGNFVTFNQGYCACGNDSAGCLENLERLQFVAFLAAIELNFAQII